MMKMPPLSNQYIAGWSLIVMCISMAALMIADLLAQENKVPLLGNRSLVLYALMFLAEALVIKKRMGPNPSKIIQASTWVILFSSFATACVGAFGRIGVIFTVIFSARTICCFTLVSDESVVSGDDDHQKQEDAKRETRTKTLDDNFHPLRVVDV